MKLYLVGEVFSIKEKEYQGTKTTTINFVNDAEDDFIKVKVNEAEHLGSDIVKGSKVNIPFKMTSMLGKDGRIKTYYGTEGKIQISK